MKGESSDTKKIVTSDRLRYDNLQSTERNSKIGRDNGKRCAKELDSGKEKSCQPVEFSGVTAATRPTPPAWPPPAPVRLRPPRRHPSGRECPPRTPARSRSRSPTCVCARAAHGWSCGAQTLCCLPSTLKLLCGGRFSGESDCGIEERVVLDRIPRKKTPAKKSPFVLL